MDRQIVALATQVISPENTPEKRRTDSLIAKPRWKYKGPGETIRFEWQIGKWGWAGFAGESTRQYATRFQPASTVLKEFDTSLPSISLSSLSPGYYDCEIWFKNKFPDLRVIVQNCVRVVEEAPPGEYILTLRAAPSIDAGWITKEPDKSKYAKEVVRLTAHRIWPYEFSYFDIDGEPFMLNPMDLYVTRNYTITAHFRRA